LPVDLAHDLEAALDGAVDLVTTTALLDLVSEPWLDRLVTEIAARRLPLYAALSYDGRIVFDPPVPGDAAIMAAVNAHQRGDKGFGRALEKPTAAGGRVARFHGGRLRGHPRYADWVIGPRDRDMQNELLTGWAGAARERGSPPFNETIAWLTRRRGLVAAGRSSIRVGHVDFFASPIANRRADRSHRTAPSPSSW